MGRKTFVLTCQATSQATSGRKSFTLKKVAFFRTNVAKYFIKYNWQIKRKSIFKIRIFMCYFLTLSKNYGSKIEHVWKTSNIEYCDIQYATERNICSEKATNNFLGVNMFSWQMCRQTDHIAKPRIKGSKSEELEGIYQKISSVILYVQRRWDLIKT